MAVDVIKCHDALQEALEWTTAGQGLEVDGVVDKACGRVIAEIQRGASAATVEEEVSNVSETPTGGGN